MTQSCTFVVPNCSRRRRLFLVSPLTQIIDHLPLLRLPSKQLQVLLPEPTQSIYPLHMSTILNKPYDAFADEEEGPTSAATVVKKTTAEYIHIRIQQRNGRKTITTLQGVPTEYDPKKLLKAFKKEFACNGSIVDDEESGQVIQLQGDQRTKILTMLVEEGINKETIKLHGF